MKKVFITSILLMLCNFIQAQNKNFIDQPYIETISVSDTVVVPDIIYLSIYITERIIDKKVFFDNLDEEIIERFQTIGIDVEEQLFLSELSSNVTRNLLSNTMFRSKTFELLVYDVKTIGEVILALQELGRFTYSVVETGYSDIDNLQLRFRNKAAKQGEVQAEKILEATGGSVGRLLYASDILDSANDLSSLTYGVNLRQESRLQTNIECISVQPIVVSSKLLMRFEIE